MKSDRDSDFRYNLIENKYFKVPLHELNVQCDQVPKPENRQVFAKNSHVWRVEFQPPIFPAPFPAPVINVYFKYYFYLIYAILWLQTFDTMIIY